MSGRLLLLGLLAAALAGQAAAFYLPGVAPIDWKKASRAGTPLKLPHKLGTARRAARAAPTAAQGRQRAIGLRAGRGEAPLAAAARRRPTRRPNRQRRAGAACPSSPRAAPAA